MTDTIPQIHLSTLTNNLPGVIKAYYAYGNPNDIYNGKTPLDNAVEPEMITLLILLGGMCGDEIFTIDSNIFIGAANDRIGNFELTESLYHRVQALKTDSEIDEFVSDLTGAVS